MARRVFFSFHFDNDAWRAGQVRNMGSLEGNEPVSDNDWEEVKKGGDAAIEKWIEGQLKGRSCVVVLIGSKTSSRKWIKHEIIEGWNSGKGVVGIHVHGLKGSDGKTAAKGSNPFSAISMKNGGTLADHVSAHDPTRSDSAKTYDVIKANLANWVEDAVASRS